MQKMQDKEKSLREEIRAYVKKEYGTTTEFLWPSSPRNEVLRHSMEPDGKTPKWYGIIMEVKREKLGLTGDGYIDILDVKCDPEKVSFLKMAEGYRPAYHMNKTSWITILLDGTVSMENIKALIEESFRLTEKKVKKKKEMPKCKVVEE